MSVTKKKPVRRQKHEISPAPRDLGRCVAVKATPNMLEKLGLDADLEEVPAELTGHNGGLCRISVLPTPGCPGGVPFLIRTPSSLRWIDRFPVPISDDFRLQGSDCEALIGGKRLTGKLGPMTELDTWDFQPKGTLGANQRVSVPLLALRLLSKPLPSAHDWLIPKPRDYGSVVLIILTPSMRARSRLHSRVTSRAVLVGPAPRAVNNFTVSFLPEDGLSGTAVVSHARICRYMGI